ncbi:MAG: tRNA preQ1(34) S-adenosylmethionine ribosyltransferase-isomerase QueA [Verrucomicrobia bacterium]|nr:tRNA preQ1(34) S-adenosylmethionine ribosyltransferase-isomerase QueA [Verrucomicrobiota bacterium]
MRTADFDFALPPELIAQAPAAQRDHSRLLALERSSGKLAHLNFRDVLKFFRAGDVLALNNSKVIPARLRGVKKNSGGEVEILLLEKISRNDWWVMLRPGKRVRPGTEIIFHDRAGNPAGFGAEVREKNDEGHCRLVFTGTDDILASAEKYGETPLPPYIARTSHTNDEHDRERYQTIYAQPRGSVAAPTAGLHFTAPLLDEIRALGVHVCFVTLHVGPGTFAPVKADTLAQHVMHEERFEISTETVSIINQAKAEKRRVFAVGTTTTHVLESVAAEHGGQLTAKSGRTRIFIYPPYRFQIVDALLTNFHLPQSTLLMLVSAFAAPGETGGRETILTAYAEAVRERYRFFSYGDAMLIH